MRGKLRKALRWFLVLVAAACVAIVLGTLVPRPLLTPAASSDQATRHILVLASPIHTDIAVPIDHQTLADFAFLRDAGLPVDHPDARWMLFGWGSRAYYMATPTFSDSSFGPLFKALTVDASVMHAEILGALDETDPAVSSFEVPEAGYQRMLPSSAPASPRRMAHLFTSRARITARMTASSKRSARSTH